MPQKDWTPTNVISISSAILWRQPDSGEPGAYDAPDPFAMVRAPASPKKVKRSCGATTLSITFAIPDSTSAERALPVIRKAFRTPLPPQGYTYPVLSETADRARKECTVNIDVDKDRKNVLKLAYMLSKKKKLQTHGEAERVTLTVDQALEAFEFERKDVAHSDANKHMDTLLDAVNEKMITGYVPLRDRREPPPRS